MRKASLTAYGFVSLAIAVAPAQQQYRITTIVGGIPPASQTVALGESIGKPQGLTLDASGNLYFTGLNCVFRLSRDGVMTRVAGNSRAGYSGDGGPAVSAQLDDPSAVAIDHSGNLYIVDSDNNRIRKASASGIITTLAGGGRTLGDGGLASASQLDGPSGLAVDAAGNIFISDRFHYRVRKVSLDGIITTVAGNGSRGSSGDGGPATKAQLMQPGGIAVDSTGSIYIADLEDHRVRKVSENGIISTLVGNGKAGYFTDQRSAITAQLNVPRAVALDGFGNVFIAEYGNSRVLKVAADGIVSVLTGDRDARTLADGGPATKVQLSCPYGMATDRDGNLYIADTDNSRILKASPNGLMTTVAGEGSGSQKALGDGGPAERAHLKYPVGVSLDRNGSLYIADQEDCRIRKVDTNGIITAVAGNGLPGFSGDGGLATAAQLNQPTAVVVDRVGNAYVADAKNSRIRRISVDGRITTVAGTDEVGYAGDGGPGTKAKLNVPLALAIDGDGNLYIADSGNSRVRRLSVEGIIVTVAGSGKPGNSGDRGSALKAQLDYPNALAVDSIGNLYIADGRSNRIRKVSTNGTITTVAGGGMSHPGNGGQATDAGLGIPVGLAVDGAGNLYISDSSTLIRRVASDGVITTIAGNGTRGYSGDGGYALNAQLNEPIGLAVDRLGNLYVADSENKSIRLVNASGLPPNRQNQELRD